ncbi:Carboxypeptidase B2 [Willisornis vidua]|uniref:Carboxypeptidase B2 n=1 Tax=Willisornis vidua TaxID=1566151 RepID=A0ABQ9DQZ4_9PASS|nr:Carboxypeptidase B2 [Willisornis vidua]
MGNSDRIQWNPGRKLEEGNERDPFKDKLKEQPGKQDMRTESERKEVTLWQPVVVEYIKKDREVHFYVRASNINSTKAQLRKLAIQHKVLIGDVQGFIENQTVNDTVNPRGSSSYYENYHSMKEAIHVRERDPTMTMLLEHFDFYVMPVMNVDGYEYTWSHPSNRLWRKSRSSHGNSKCIGTDMNRNFDAHWCGQGASPHQCQETYCGPYPESEPEVKAVARFLRDHKDTIKAYITMHSYSQLVLFPYSYTRNKSKDHDELESVAKKAAKAIRRTTKETYTPGPGAQTIYLAPGGSDDWAYDLGIKYSFTFELRDTGTYGFLLPSREIRPTCLEALSAVKEIAKHVLQNL